jgi:hypothetical protein
MDSGFKDNLVPMDEIIKWLYLSRVHLFWIMEISPTSPYFLSSWTTSRYSRF